MAGSKLKAKFDIIGMEQQTSVFGSAVALSNDFTIPGNTGAVLCHPSAACHWHPTGTPTSTYGHAVVADELFEIPAHQVGSAKIIGDAGVITLTVAYRRGAGRADGGGSLTRPY